MTQLESLARDTKYVIRCTTETADEDISSNLGKHTTEHGMGNFLMTYNSLSSFNRAFPVEFLNVFLLVVQDLNILSSFLI